jgi:enamine deaminase RidA (YjgF/YER057c/UK114 family)
MTPDARTRDARFTAAAADLGHRFEGELVIGGNYTSTVRHGDVIYVSGQLPRVGATVAVMGRVGLEASLDDGRRAARICTMRALALLRQALGSLDAIERILRMTVYVRSAPDFTQQSEIGDGASDLLHAVLGDAGVHTRTSIGVYQLPKGAAVEVDMIAAVVPAASERSPA